MDGAPATSVEFTLNDQNTVVDIISILNSQLLAGSPTSPVARAVWSTNDTSIHIFSVTTGNGSSIEITEPAIDGLLTALTNVALGSPPNSELPVLNYLGGSPAITIIYPPFPSNVTQVTADMGYEEVSDTFNTTSVGNQSSSIRFNSPIVAGAVVEMIVETISTIN